MDYLTLLHYMSFISLLASTETKKPNDKQQQAVWRLECELGVIADSECPTDGGWTPWSPWSACNGACDDLGQRRRFRECNNPPPSLDGFPCLGTDHQIEPCYINNCTIDDYRKLVAGDVIRNEAFHQLEAIPDLMERCLLIECPLEAIEVALASDNTWQFNSESLWNSFQCVKHNLGCPVIGEWGSWSEWSACGARCGYGLRWRHRKCDTPPPSSVHLICSGTPLQVDECQGDQCAVNKRDSGGNWSKWGQWSACSESCGAGIKRRKRICLEINTPRLFSSWGTHCRGQHDQLEVCENKQCKLDGGWSGWGAWGPCSQTCGAGRHSRSRSCTRPEPSGGGTFCSGPRTEVGSCHLKPCKSFLHNVATLNGESFLHYDFKNKRSKFFHFYIRFLPLSPHGTLVRRGDVQNSLVRLSLQKWHICLDAGGLSPSCTLSRICSRNVLEPATWHSVLITVTSEGTTMRLDDEPVALRSTFSCDPELPNEKVNVIVGERLHGEIQELILNFIPLCIVIDRSENVKSNYCPREVSNIAYERAGAEEAYLTLNYDYILRLPCIDDQEDWRIQLTVKPLTETGTILFLQNKLSHTWLLLYLQNMKLKLKLAVDDFRSESGSSLDFLPNQWLDIIISKSRDTKTIEVSINLQERLHVSFEDFDAISRKRQTFKNYSTKENSNQKSNFALCADEFFIGGVPPDVKTHIKLDDLSCFSGIIASVIVNNVLLDLNDFSVERYKNNNVQVSSRTASVSGSYYETAWGKSNHLNLTCLHALSVRFPNTAHWLFLDSAVHSALKKKTVRSVDDGRVLRLVATADNDIRGFYTCRVHGNRRNRNIVTYGVIGQIEHKISGPDLTTAIAVITTLALVLGTLACLFVEGIHDIRNGYGFFRDAHMSPKEEAEVVCKYIDQNMHLIASKSAADAAKAKARRIGRQISCDSSSVSDEPEGLMLVENLLVSTENSNIPSELEDLPVLPEKKSFDNERTHDVFKCEQSYVSSPRHGSISSPKTKLTSSSSFEVTSPRLLCSRLLLAKRFYLSREKMNKKSHAPRKSRSKLLTIKSSSYINQPVAQRILRKFRELKSDDINN